VKRAAAALVLAAGLTGLLQVGREGGQSSAQAAVRQAAAKSAEADSSRFTISWQGPQLPDRSLLPTVEGTMNYLQHRGRVRYGDQFELIYDGEITYAKWPMPWRHDAAWLRYEAGSNEPDPLDLQDRATRNPIGLLAFLTGAGDDVHVVGSEFVRGVETKHYEGTLDLQKVVDQAAAAKHAELQDSLNFLFEGAPKTVPFGLWVDGEGVAHRLRIDQPGGATITIEYYDFGIPIEVTPPPAKEIVSNEEFFKEMMRHQGDSSCDNGDTGSGGSSSSGAGGPPHPGKAKSVVPTRPGRAPSSSPAGGSGNGSSATICVESTE
jgi:hypothetical protein